MKRELTLTVDGREVVVLVERRGDRIVVERDSERHEIMVVADRRLAEAPAGVATPASAPSPVPDAAASDRAYERGDVVAPMVGVVREVHVAAGSDVVAGQRIVTMEAMKMDIPVDAPVSGRVSAVLCRVGDTTADGTVLASIVPRAGES